MPKCGTRGLQLKILFYTFGRKHFITNMPKTTLVIHPKDPTTDCLSVIYEGRNWTVIRDSDTPRDIVEEQIRTIII